MRYKYLARHLLPEVNAHLDAFPAVALLGPRQCGKSTLAKCLIQNIKQSVYLVLERGQKRIAIECKMSNAPKVTPRILECAEGPGD